MPSIRNASHLHILRATSRSLFARRVRTKVVCLFVLGLYISDALYAELCTRCVQCLGDYIPYSIDVGDLSKHITMCSFLCKYISLSLYIYIYFVLFKKYIYVCVCVCVCIYIYIYIYIHTRDLLLSYKSIKHVAISL